MPPLRSASIDPSRTAILSVGEVGRPVIPGMTLEEELGRGGFGVVWKARWALPSGIEKVVAVKRLRTDVPNADDLARRLRDEARMLARVRHRAVVRVEDLLVVDGAPVLVTEYVEGQDLRELVAAGPLPPRVVAELLAEVASALEAAHAGVSDGAGRVVPLVHRDLKPGNLRVTPWGEVKLLDFGAARAEMVDRESDTRQQAMGSPDYLAPEAEAGAPSPASDLYALGIVAWESLTGERLGKLARSRGLHVDQVARAAARLPDERLATVVRALVAYAPTERPTAREVRERLDLLAPDLDGPSLRAWAATTLGSPGAPSRAPAMTRLPADTAPVRPGPVGLPPADLVRAPDASRARTRPWWLFAAAGGLVGGLAAVGLLGVVALVWTLTGG